MCLIKRLLFLSILLFPAPPAGAHFQLLYTPQLTVERPTELPFRLVFWHPFSNGHVMGMDQPESFVRILRGEATDLLGTLRPITFQGAGNGAGAFESTFRIKRSGDHIFVLTPAPYLEESEDIYIQQITKTIVNKDGIPTGWNAPLGLPAEIVPLNKPYGVMAGSTFSGRVLSGGQPVAGTEVEIEYIAAEPDLRTNRARPATMTPPPGGAVVAVTDADGVFTFGIPWPGFWGFAALGVGPQTEHRGKRLSQDAVIWVRAHRIGDGVKK